jgi:hypothetical protein
MTTLRLWAIGIDQVRSIFSADPATADRLRDAANQRFGVTTTPQRGLLGRLGPFLRGGGDPAAPRPGVPTSEDVEDLLAGRFVPPPRLAQSWNLLEFWLGTLAVGSGEWPLTESGLTELDFDLARAQVPSRYAIADLFKANLGLSLTRCPGLAAGWVPGQHALGMRESWSAGLAELNPESQQLAAGIIEFLGGFEEWASPDAGHGYAQPDLIAIFRA